MLFDIFKRQTKEDRLQKLIEQKKLKMSEAERTKAFNRLINDANRRFKAINNMEDMKERLEQANMESKKYYNDEEWTQIYDERFIKFEQERIKKLEAKLYEERKKKEESEAALIEELRKNDKKAPTKEIKEIVKRLYDEAERRQAKMANLRSQNEEADIESYKSQVTQAKKTTTYNFMVLL